jgi:hypothetical protein
MELRAAELTLESLDAADVEAAALFIVDEDRPLRGLAGLCDWRMCGALSRTLSGGWYQGRTGETLLMPTEVGLHAIRVFVFGLGASTASSGASAMEEALPRAFQALRRARITSCCLSLPWPGTELDSALDLWVKRTAEGPERQLLLGDTRQIQRWFESAAVRLPDLRLHIQAAELAALPGRVGDGRISRVGRDRSEP